MVTDRWLRQTLFNPTRSPTFQNPRTHHNTTRRALQGLTGLDHNEVDAQGWAKLLRSSHRMHTAALLADNDLKEVPR